MSGYKAARDLKFDERDKYSMAVTRESMLALEKIAVDLEKEVGVRLTRSQVLKHLINVYQTNQLTKNRGRTT